MAQRQQRLSVQAQLLAVGQHFQVVAAPFGSGVLEPNLGWFVNKIKKEKILIS